MSEGERSDATAESDNTALDQMVEVHPDLGRPYARLSEYGTPIWVLINRMGDPIPENIARVAWEYQIPEIAVRAALRYYERNKKHGDAVIISSNEPFGLNELSVARFYVDEHADDSLAPPFVLRGHDALSTWHVCRMRRA